MEASDDYFSPRATLSGPCFVWHASNSYGLFGSSDGAGRESTRSSLVLHCWLPLCINRYHIIPAQRKIFQVTAGYLVPRNSAVRAQDQLRAISANSSSGAAIEVLSMLASPCS